jgi:hypothetical protein
MIKDAARRRSLGNLFAVLCMPAAGLWPDSRIAQIARDLAMTYIACEVAFRAWSGYVRRRRYWTSESWRRYLTACAVPVISLGMLVFMLFALEWRLPFIGARRSTARGVFAAVSMIFMIVGSVGLVTVIEWLHEGDPSGSFTLPSWLRRRRPHIA